VVVGEEMAGAGTGGHGYPPAWTGYKRSVTIDGASYEELEYQFCSRRRKLTIHRRHALDDRGLRRRRFSRTLDDVRSGSVKNLKVPYPTRRLCRGSTPSSVLGCWPDGLELTPGFYRGSNEQHRLF